MKIYSYLYLLLIFTFSIVCPGQSTPTILPEAKRIDANSKIGFSYPFYLYVPPKLQNEKNKNAKQTILIVPNNTGGANDDYAVHEKAAKKQAEDLRGVATRLNVAVLVPAFPRPKIDWRIYTHALDRDAMLTDKKEYRRFDLQLIRMIDDARKRLGADYGLQFDKKVFMLGFSAAGMFTNRFAFLHPQRVKAAAFGSPGGWAIAPVELWKNKKLRYPIGISDFKIISGKKLDIKKLRGVPLFLFMGDEDMNDSVVYRDSYEQEDEKLILELFGKTLLERWAITKNIYAENLPETTLKLYPKVGHSWSKEMWADVITFFSKHSFE